MTTAERSKMLASIDRVADSMERTSKCLREIGVELRAVRRDLEDLQRRVGKLESQRRAR